MRQLEAMKLRAERRASPRKDPLFSAEDRLRGPQAEEASEMVWHAEERDAHLPLAWRPTIACQALSPREPNVCPLRSRKDGRGRRGTALAGWVRGRPHLDALSTDQLHTGTSIHSPAPVSPEQRCRTHDKRMQQDTDLPRLHCGASLPLALLAQRARSIESVIAWLEAYPEVEIVSRDRGGTYVDGVTQGTPLATQVCDRWHLLKNLGEAVEDFLIRAHIRLPETHAPQPTQERPLTTYSATPAQQGKTQARLLRKWKLYKQIHELHEGGMSLRQIGEELGLSRNTVRKYFRQALEAPLPTPKPLRARKLDPYEDYILTRLSQGCTNAAQIHREITDMGFSGGTSNVKAYVAHLRKSTADGGTPVKRSERAQALSPRALRWLLTKQREDLDQKEQAQLDVLLQTSSDAQVIQMLLHQFLAVVRERKPQQLRPWMEEASKSGITELKSFVTGIERDYDAVKEALRLPWSQGQTEGQITRLKLIKRQGYGRARFDLLRQRVLHAA